MQNRLANKIVIVTSATSLLFSACTKKKSKADSSENAKDPPTETVAPESTQQGPTIQGTVALETGADLAGKQVVVQTFDNKLMTGKVNTDGSFTVEAPPVGVPFTVMLQTESGTQLTGASVTNVAALDFGDLGFSQSLAGASGIKLSITANTAMRSAQASVDPASKAALVDAGGKTKPLPDVGGTYTGVCKEDAALGTDNCADSADILPSGFYLAQDGAKLSLWKSEAEYSRCSATDSNGMPIGYIRVKRTDLSPATTKEVKVDFTSDESTIKSLGDVFNQLPPAMQKTIIGMARVSPHGDCATGSPGIEKNPICEIYNDNSSPFHGLNRPSINWIGRMFGFLLRIYDDPILPEARAIRESKSFGSDGLVSCEKAKAPVPSWFNDFRDCKLLDENSYYNSSYSYIHDGDEFPSDLCRRAAQVYSYSRASDFYVNPDPSDVQNPEIVWHHLRIDAATGKFTYNAPVSQVVRRDADGNVTYETTSALMKSAEIDKMRFICPNFDKAISSRSDNIEYAGLYHSTVSLDFNIPFENIKGCLEEFSSMNLSGQIEALRKVSWFYDNMVTQMACQRSDDFNAYKSMAQSSCVPSMANSEQCVSIDSGLGFSFNGCTKRFECSRGLGGSCDFRSMGFLGAGKVESFGDKGFALSTFAEYKTDRFVFPESNYDTKSAVCAEYGFTGTGCNVAWNYACQHNDAFTFVSAPSSGGFLVTVNQTQGQKCKAAPLWTDGAEFPIPPEKISSSAGTFLFELNKN